MSFMKSYSFDPFLTSWNNSFKYNIILCYSLRTSVLAFNAITFILYFISIFIIFKHNLIIYLKYNLILTRVWYLNVSIYMLANIIFKIYKINCQFRS